MDARTCEHDKRFSGVMFCKNGCLACQIELAIAERDEARQHLLARDAECARWQGELAAERRAHEECRKTLTEAIASLGKVSRGLLEWRERAEKAEASLRSLASYVGNGGYNAETVDADAFEAKIRDGINEISRERDACKRAKAENDERFMIERDQARAECERLKGVLTRWECIARQAVLVGYSYRDDNRTEDWLTQELMSLQERIETLASTSELPEKKWSPETRALRDEEFSGP